jgi:hypothetical protein
VFIDENSNCLSESFLISKDHDDGWPVSVLLAEGVKVYLHDDDDNDFDVIIMMMIMVIIMISIALKDHDDGWPVSVLPAEGVKVYLIYVFV